MTEQETLSKRFTQLGISAKHTLTIDDLHRTNKDVTAAFSELLQGDFTPEQWYSLKHQLDEVLTLTRQASERVQELQRQQERQQQKAQELEQETYVMRMEM